MVRRMKWVGILLSGLLFGGVATVAQDKVVIYGGSTDAREHGYQHGYRDGLRQGRADLRNNVSPNYDSDDYRRGAFGYEEFMGARADFERGYRDGFKDGYEDGYRNKGLRVEIYGSTDAYDPDVRPRSEDDARHYPNWSYTDVAFDTGYRDGLTAGVRDFRNKKDFKPEKHDAYEDGDRGYRKDYGSKDRYKDQYRKGFLRGYEDAFNRAGR